MNDEEFEVMINDVMELRESLEHVVEELDDHLSCAEQSENSSDLSQNLLAAQESAEELLRQIKELVAKV